VATPTASEILAPILARWAHGDFSGWDECFAPDLLLTAFDPDGAHQARGPEEIGTYLRSFFRQFRDYRIEVEQLEQLSDDTLLMQGRQLGTGRLSGLEIEDDIYIVFRFTAGQLTETHWHPRREGALEAAGLRERPP
jgi:ketosteroid isomerase-like protein